MTIIEEFGQRHGLTVQREKATFSDGWDYSIRCWNGFIAMFDSGSSRLDAGIVTLEFSDRLHAAFVLVTHGVWPRSILPKPWEADTLVCRFNPGNARQVKAIFRLARPKGRCSLCGLKPPLPLPKNPFSTILPSGNPFCNICGECLAERRARSRK